MALLTSEERKKLPQSAFALPRRRAYPVHDRPHAINAKARAKQELEAGNLTEGEYDRVIKAADQKLYGSD